MPRDFKKFSTITLHLFTLSVELIISKTRERKGKKVKKILALEAVFGRCSIKKVFLKISQHLQENTCASQKQPFRGVLEKRCSENVQQIYRRILMPKYDLNKVAKHRCFSVTFARFFRTAFFKEHL